MLLELQSSRQVFKKIIKYRISYRHAPKNSIYTCTKHVYQRTQSLGILFIWITNWQADNADIYKLKKCHYIHTHLMPYVSRVSKISDTMPDFNDILYTKVLW